MAMLYRHTLDDYIARRDGGHCKKDDEKKEKRGENFWGPNRFYTEYREAKSKTHKNGHDSLSTVSQIGHLNFMYWPTDSSTDM